MKNCLFGDTHQLCKERQHLPFAPASFLDYRVTLYNILSTVDLTSSSFRKEFII